jgi:hypothetical protein
MKKIFTIILCSYLAYNATAQTQFINDPSLELSGQGGTQWIDTDFYYLSTFVNNASQAHTGNYCAYFEAVSGQQNESRMTQNIVNTTETYNNKLEFYLKCIASSGASTDIFAVSIGGGVYNYIKTGLKTDSASVGEEYKKITIKIDTLPVGFFPIIFISQSAITSSAKNIYIVDDITLTTGFPTAIADVCTTNCNIAISPTITNNNISISNVESDNTIARIYNFSGQLLYTKQLHKSFNILNMAALPSANYVLLITNPQGQIISKSKITKL